MFKTHILNIKSFGRLRYKLIMLERKIIFYFLFKNNIGREINVHKALIFVANASPVNIPANIIAWCLDSTIVMIAAIANKAVT